MQTQKSPKTPASSDSIKPIFVDWSNAYCSYKQLDELKPITFGEMSERKIYEGCFLVCQVMHRGIRPAINDWILVLDTNSDPSRVGLGFVTCAFGEVFRVGTILVIKEPNTTGNPAPVVTSPSDVVLPDVRSLDELRLAGNERFSKQFKSALVEYERALRLQPDAAVLYLNKSAALLKMERFDEAYYAAAKALAGGANRAKALFRSRGAGKYDMSRLHAAAFGEYARYVDAADWMGPVEVVSIPGRGKGIIAREDISKGTLLIVSKAIACSGANDFSDYELLKDDTREADVMRRNLIRLVQTLRRNPQWAKDVYSLYAGDKSARDETIPAGIIDMRPIHEIHRINAFKDEVSAEERTSLLIVPSFINHSCVDNVYRAHYGDVMMVYAIRDIKKGEELVWTYVSWKYPYEHREAYLWSEHRIRCDCLLCELDRSDKRRKKRDKLVQKAEVLQLLAANKRELVAKLEPLVQEIRETYSSRKQYRLRLLVPLTILYDAYSELENLNRCVRISAEILDCLDESYLLGEGPDICRKAFDLLHKFSKRYADGEHFPEHYAVVRDKYATLLRECVKVRSGLDIDFLASVTEGRITGFP